MVQFMLLHENGTERVDIIIMAKQANNPLLEKASIAESAGQFAQAQGLLVQAVKAAPQDPKPLTALVRLLNRKLKKPDVALPILIRLLKLAPKSGIAHELAAETYVNLRRYDAAAAHAEKTVALAPKSPDGLYVAATAFQHVNRYDEAVALMRTALKIRPDHMPSKILMATNLRGAGQLTEADAQCRANFAENPDNIANIAVWSHIGTIKAGDPIYLHARDNVLPRLKAANHPRVERLLLILGKAENDIGNFDQAFRNFTAAKAMQKHRHDPAINRRFVGDLLAQTSKADFFGKSGHDSESPVFIVGMPRSGSTLMEQILSSHPQIGGIGEASHIRNLAQSVGYSTNDGKGLSRIIRTLSQDKARDLAELYLRLSTEAAPGNARIVDKHLHNFEFLGLIGRLFPHARILFALRDPMDNCVSCYMQPLSRFHSYTQDLRSLGQYYSDFRRLIAHWQKVIPNPTMEVHYEDVVADTEGMARKIIDFLGLDWDPACLDFQKNTARVKTLSVAQVREPIYQSSVKRWKRYEAHLDPLKSELAGFYPDGFDKA